MSNTKRYDAIREKQLAYRDRLRNGIGRLDDISRPDDPYTIWYNEEASKMPPHTRTMRKFNHWKKENGYD